MFYILLSVIIVLLVIYKFVVWNNDYFKTRNVPYIKPTFGFGNIYKPTMMKEPFSLIHDQIYKKFRDCKYTGYFALVEPQIFLIDNELIKTVMIRDIQYFNDNGVDTTDPYFDKNPFTLKGEKWRLVRSQLSPAFSTGRIKHMFPQMLQSAGRFVTFLKTDPEIKEKNCIYAKDLCGKFTVDIVASASMNLDVKTFENPNSEFRQMGLQIFQAGSVLGQIKLFIAFTFPRLAAWLKLKIIDDKVGEFFKNVIREQVQYRKDNNIVCNDFLDFIQDVRNKCTEYDFDETHMVAHILAFFTDGFETSAITMSFILYEIASNPDVQARLREEVTAAFNKNNGKLTYEAVTEMKYLDSIITESLRLHPPIGYLRKRCMAPYKFPPSSSKYSEFECPKGMLLIIPIYSLMHDPEFYPEPDKFNPDRFSDSNKGEIVKGTFLSFGDGPRQCIGMRFATTQIKVGIACLINNFEIRVHPKTQTPLREDPSSVLLKPVGDIWIQFHELKEKKIN